MGMVELCFIESQENMNNAIANLLLIEGDAAYTEVIQKAAASSGRFQMECVSQLSDALERLRLGGIGVILVNLFLADSKGFETFEKLYLTAPNVPILILTTPSGEIIARKAVKAGARDYLLKTHMHSESLTDLLNRTIERKNEEEALFVERDRAGVMLDSIGDAVLSMDVSGKVTFLNPVAEAMTGWPRVEAMGRPLAQVLRIIDEDSRKPSRNPMEQAVQENKTIWMKSNRILIRRDGFEAAIEDSAAPIHDRDGNVTGAVMVFHDVSAERAMSLQLSHLAEHDFLTGLPNRLLLNDRLTQAISLSRRHSGQLAVLFLDLDRFKNINDSLGHDIGDQLLQSVASRLASCVRRSDTVSRQGGDEFVILLPELNEAQDAAITATKILDAVTLPHDIGPHSIQISASIGVSIYPEDGGTADVLTRNADAAMYEAKENGRNSFQFFKQVMNIRAMERQFFESGLRRALKRGEFLLHYQPIINLTTGEVTGAEALIRWPHPERGLIPPAQFVPIAEDCGLILPIGQWVLRKACKQARAWMDAGLRPIHISVNISALEFRAANFLEGVNTILRDTRLDPHCLELEITESVLMKHAESTANVLQALKTMGVQLVVDDFGTGYSSLSHLNRFPIDVLKIDQSFVKDICSNPDQATIVSAVISMGKSLKKRVIAEGIETKEQLESLRAWGCEEGQGYFFNRPMVADEFAMYCKGRALEMGVA
jgi:diguanylate cyclase (GGDEF)-like protein/PAS domain S-box-containing protein